MVLMALKLKRSLRRYLSVRNELIPVVVSFLPHLFLDQKGGK